MGPVAAGITASLAVIAYVGFVGGAVNFFFPESAAPEASNPSSSPESPVAALSFPLPYSASITQSGDGIDEPRTRFYFTRAAKGAQ